MMKTKIQKLSQNIKKKKKKSYLYWINGQKWGNGLMNKELMKKMQSFTIYKLQNLQKCQTPIK